MKSAAILLCALFMVIGLSSANFFPGWGKPQQGTCFYYAGFTCCPEGVAQPQPQGQATCYYYPGTLWRASLTCCPTVAAPAPAPPAQAPSGPAAPPTAPSGPAAPPTAPSGPAAPPTAPSGPAAPPTAPAGPAAPPTAPAGPAAPPSG